MFIFLTKYIELRLSYLLHVLCLRSRLPAKWFYQPMLGIINYSVKFRGILKVVLLSGGLY